MYSWSWSGRGQLPSPVLGRGAGGEGVLLPRGIPRSPVSASPPPLHPSSLILHSSSFSPSAVRRPPSFRHSTKNSWSITVWSKFASSTFHSSCILLENRGENRIQRLSWPGNVTDRLFQIGGAGFGRKSRCDSLHGGPCAKQIIWQTFRIVSAQGISLRIIRRRAATDTVATARRHAVGSQAVGLKRFALLWNVLESERQNSQKLPLYPVEMRASASARPPSSCSPRPYSGEGGHHVPMVGVSADCSLVSSSPHLPISAPAGPPGTATRTGRPAWRSSAGCPRPRRRAPAAARSHWQTVDLAPPSVSAIFR